MELRVAVNGAKWNIGPAQQSLANGLRGNVAHLHRIHVFQSPAATQTPDIAMRGRRPITYIFRIFFLKDIDFCRGWHFAMLLLQLEILHTDYIEFAKVVLPHVHRQRNANTWHIRSPAETFILCGCCTPARASRITCNTHIVQLVFSLIILQPGNSSAADWMCVAYIGTHQTYGTPCPAYCPAKVPALAGNNPLNSLPGNVPQKHAPLPGSDSRTLHIYNFPIVQGNRKCENCRLSKLWKKYDVYN